MIDDVRIYNRAITPTEVARLYNVVKPKAAIVPLRQGLVGYWDFNEGEELTANDRSGKVNHATLTNMFWDDWVDSRAKLGKSLDFDGTNDYVKIPANTSMLTNVPTASFSVWVRPDTVAINQEIVSLSINTVSASSRGAVDLVSNAIDCGGRSTDAELFQKVTASAAVTAGAWHHIACTINYAADIVLIYVNGVRQTTSGTPAFSASATPNNTSAVGAIGAEDDGATNFFDDLIDDVRVYNRILPPEEVQRLYLLGR